MQVREIVIQITLPESLAEELTLAAKEQKTSPEKLCGNLIQTALTMRRDILARCGKRR